MVDFTAATKFLAPAIVLRIVFVTAGWYPSSDNTPYKTTEDGCIGTVLF